MTTPLVYTVAELQQALRCGRHTALSVANAIGIRISPRRIVVPRARLEAWLESGSAPSDEMLSQKADS